MAYKELYINGSSNLSNLEFCKATEEEASGSKNRLASSIASSLPALRCKVRQMNPADLCIHQAVFCFPFQTVLELNVSGKSRCTACNLLIFFCRRSTASAGNLASPEQNQPCICTSSTTIYGWIWTPTHPAAWQSCGRCGSCSQISQRIIIPCSMQRCARLPLMPSCFSLPGRLCCVEPSKVYLAYLMAPPFCSASSAHTGCACKAVAGSCRLVWGHTSDVMWCLQVDYSFRA